MAPWAAVRTEESKSTPMGHIECQGGGCQTHCQKNVAGVSQEGARPRYARPCWWPKREPWTSRQRWLSEALESNVAHLTVISLVILDMILVIVELILSSSYCDLDTRPPSVQRTIDGLWWTSKGILIIFVVELTLRLLVYGFPYYVGNWIHDVDALIVVSSLVLELSLRGVVRDMMAMLVFFRLWRVVRIMSAILAAMESKHQEELHKLMVPLEELLKDLASAQHRAAELEAEIKVTSESAAIHEEGGGQVQGSSSDRGVFGMLGKLQKN